MIFGTRTEQALVKVSVQARAHFYKRARQCMPVITKKLLQYLPWENIILRASRLLSPSYRSSTMFPKWLKQAALSLPTVISSEQIDQLLLEGEQYQLHSQDIADNNAKDILEHWKLTTQSKFPLLQALVRAMLVLPHGNSDVERLFSNLHDIITDKRNSLSSVTVEALAVSRSYMRSQGLECHSFPITPSLLTAIQNSRHAYSIRVAAERKQAEENEAKQRERSLQEELQRQLAESKRLQSIAKRKEDTAVQRKEQEEKRKRAHALRDAADALLLETEGRLASLDHEEKHLADLRERENHKLLQQVLHSAAKKPRLE